MSKRTRRRFIQEVSALGFGSYLAFATGACSKKSAEPAPPPPKPQAAPPHPTIAVPSKLESLTPAQYLAAAAASERILPRDEDPGAQDLGVPQYIDRAFAGADLNGWRAPFLRGLDALDRQALRLHGAEFANLTAPQQDALLSAWQKGASGERRFFELLMALTFEGAFGDPSYGGNRDDKGFTLVGFLPPEPTPHGSHGG